MCTEKYFNVCLLDYNCIWKMQTLQKYAKITKPSCMLCDNQLVVNLLKPGCTYPYGILSLP